MQSFSLLVAASFYLHFYVCKSTHKTQSRTTIDGDDDEVYQKDLRNCILFFIFLVYCVPFMCRSLFYAIQDQFPFKNKIEEIEVVKKKDQKIQQVKNISRCDLHHKNICVR